MSDRKNREDRGKEKKILMNRRIDRLSRNNPHGGGVYARRLLFIGRNRFEVGIVRGIRWVNNASRLERAGFSVERRLWGSEMGSVWLCLRGGSSDCGGEKLEKGGGI